MIFRPFYPPREFGCIVVCVISLLTGRQQDWLYYVHQELQCTLNTPVFVLGEFNHYKLEQSLPGFKQYVTCGTLEIRILDRCYGNNRNAYIDMLHTC